MIHLASSRSSPSLDKKLMFCSIWLDRAYTLTSYIYLVDALVTFMGWRNIPSFVFSASSFKKCFHSPSSFIWNQIYNLSFVCWISFARRPVKMWSLTYTKIITILPPMCLINRFKSNMLLTYNHYIHETL